MALTPRRAKALAVMTRNGSLGHKYEAEHEKHDVHVDVSDSTRWVMSGTVDVGRQNRSQGVGSCSCVRSTKQGSRP